MATPQITFVIEAIPEDALVRGNAMASGDDQIDRDVEDAIFADLERGNQWAWCSVTVTARCGGFQGHDYLGCCSYASQDDFCQPDGYYWDDMRREALRDLLDNLEASHLLWAELADIDPSSISLESMEVCELTE